MRMSEAELKELLKANKALKCSDIPAKKATKTKSARPSQFDSLAEEMFYNDYIYPLILTKEIKSIELHREFVILEELEYSGQKLKSKKYTPDFLIYLSTGKTLVIEIKGSVVKRLQRDYQLRKHLFIEKYAKPNGWEFKEIKAEEVTQGLVILGHKKTPLG